MIRAHLRAHCVAPDVVALHLEDLRCALGREGGSCSFSQHLVVLGI
jgi:hypothetical protein